MNALDLLTLALAIWYLSYCVVKLPGPYGVLTWVRTKGEVFKCIYCFSLWVSIGFAVLWFTPVRALVYPFALAGAALMLHRYTGGDHL